jgi:hypothetical protein
MGGDLYFFIVSHAFGKKSLSFIVIPKLVHASRGRCATKRLMNK